MCHYNILNGTLNGEPITHANVGDQLIHKWRCNYGSISLSRVFYNFCSGKSLKLAEICGTFHDFCSILQQYDENRKYKNIWSIKNLLADDRGMLVHSCFIRNSMNRSFEFINERGRATFN